MQGAVGVVLRSKIVLGAIAIVLIAGAAGGYYLYSRPSHTPQTTIPAAARPSAPPSIVVGAQTTQKTATAEFLTVASTDPAPNATGVAVNAPITINFNLPVDPEAVGKSTNILPGISGTWAQGPTDASAVFTPSANYSAGSPVSLVIHSGLASRDGFALETDFQVAFVTQFVDGVYFQSGYSIAKVLNAQGGQPVKLKLGLGDQVPNDISVKTYKASINDMLSALVYGNDQAYSATPIDVSHMQLLDTKGPVKDQDQMTVSQPDGIYLLVASDPSGEFGRMWLDLSRYGVLLRQDDQRIVVVGQDLTTGDNSPTFNITFYTLKDRVVGTPQVSFSGTAEFPAKYPVGYDLAVATNGDEVVVVPMAAPLTDADIKVTQDLSQHPQIYMTTDRAAYSKGDTVKFAGVVRVSNDQQYAIPSNLNVEVWMEGQPPPVDIKVVAGADGIFSGSFVIPGAAFSTDGTDATDEVYASIVGAPQIYPLSATFVVALGAHSPSARLSVSLDKTEYVLKDTIKATISGTTNAGAPLTNQSVTVTILSADQPAAPKEIQQFASPSIWGTPVKDPFPVTLDATGHAVYSFAANIAGRAADQQVTLEVTYGAGAGQAVSARTALVYQAADEVFLLPSRTAYAVGDQVVAPFVVETRAGERVPNAPMAYEFDSTVYSGSTSTTTVILGGTVTTDANGLGVIKIPYAGPVDGIVLKVKGNDAAGDTFEDTKWLTIAADPSGLVTFNGIDTLVQLGVTQDKIAYRVGDTASLTVTAPVNESVLMSLERGRIHSYKWLALKAGDNALSINITPDLAPGFSIVFSYFRNGAYLSEGLPIPIDNTDRLLKVTLAADKTSYASGSTAQLTVTVTDSAGKPVAATLFADAYDALMSSLELVDQASIGGTFFRPGLRATNGSSSLVGIGNYGGRCGGGGGSGNQYPVTLAGKSTLWNAGLPTDATTGQATVSVPIATGTVRLVVIASTSATDVGQAELDLTVP
ncbi:MAG TPA: Ig-like domain-containing protein [Candidatus Dormibacteraeota bacterium]|nr:Ig-like domain-containing protein [Candidatus Dormibacteraeota bacterium]